MFPVAVTVGGVLTVTTAIAVEVALALSLHVTVYEVVTVGEAITDAPVVTLKPVAGDQLYVYGAVPPVPVALRITEDPWQIVPLLTDTVFPQLLTVTTTWLVHVETPSVIVAR